MARKKVQDCTFEGEKICQLLKKDYSLWDTNKVTIPGKESAKGFTRISPRESGVKKTERAEKRTGRLFLNTLDN